MDLSQYESDNRLILFAGNDIYRFRPLEGYDMPIPSIKVKIVKQPKVESKTYLAECAKAKFIEEELGRISRQSSRE